MFDIGFSELLLFGVIALIVLGPEKLPQAARTAGQWYAKLRRTVSTLQSEIEAELDLAETRQQMKEELAKIRQTEAEMKREMAEIRGSMQDFEYSQNQSMDAINKPKNSNSNHYQSHDDRKQDMFDELEEESSITSNMPSEFAYDYEEDESFNIYDNEDINDVDLDEDHESSLSLSSTSNNIAPPIMTRPWENMWFRLSAYDKARRLPAPPYLPNYEADTLLHDGFSHSNFSHHDLDEKMEPIDEELESIQAELELSESYSSDNTPDDNVDQNKLPMPSSLIKQETPK